MSIIQNGNVGIGTSAPTYSLDVQSTDCLHGLNWQCTSGTETGSYVRFGSNNARGALFIGNPNVGGQFGSDEAALLQTTGGWQWNKQLNIMGPVGINTNSPGAMLSVNGNVDIGGALNVSGTKCRVVHTDQFGDVFYNAVESGEAIFTTSGRSHLQTGKCHVELDQKWLAGVMIDDRHPLDVTSITFYGPHGDWYIVPGSSGFDLIDPSGANTSFFWAVQARQKGYENRFLDQPGTIAKK